MSSESPMLRTDDGNIVQFKWEPRRNNFESDREGRPIFEQHLLAYVMSPGSKLSIPAFRVCRKDTSGKEIWDRHFQQMFSKQLKMWESASPDVGTPLDQLTILDVAMIAAMKEMKVFTVEMLADVSDGNLANLGMGARKWRDAARAYLDQAKGNAAVTAVAAENAALRAELDALKAMITAPKAGRPRKVREEVPADDDEPDEPAQE
jgi:hypothetical protein